MFAVINSQTSSCHSCSITIHKIHKNHKIRSAYITIQQRRNSRRLEELCKFSLQREYKGFRRLARASLTVTKNSCGRFRHVAAGPARFSVVRDLPSLAASRRRYLRISSVGDRLSKHYAALRSRHCQVGIVPLSSVMRQPSSLLYRIAFSQ